MVSQYSAHSSTTSAALEMDSCWQRLAATGSVSEPSLHSVIVIITSCRCQPLTDSGCFSVKKNKAGTV